MIQRKQSLWLLVSATFAFLQIKFPVYHGEKLVANVLKYTELNAATNIIQLIITVALAVISLVTIFMYKNRSHQIKFSFIALFLSLGNIYFYWYLIKDFTQGNYSITIIFTVTVPILIIMAIVGIYRDQRLVKSLDRLR